MLKTTSPPYSSVYLLENPEVQTTLSGYWLTSIILEKNPHPEVAKKLAKLFSGNL